MADVITVEEKVKADIKYWKRRREDAKDKSEKIDRELEKLHKVEHGFQNALTMLQGVDQ